MNKKAVVYFDILNILACLCVIGMHVNGIAHNLDNSPAWYRSFVVEVLAYWAVPVFFMLSGATMMNYRERYTTATFIKRRIKKIGIPLVFWTTVFYLWFLHEGVYVWSGFRNLINMVINFEVVGVYWFFPPLLVIYMSMPVLSKLSNDKNILWYMIVVGVAANSVFPFACKLLGLSYYGYFYFTLTGEYILYPLVGYYLHTTELKPWKCNVIYLFGIAGAFMRYFHTVWTLNTQGVASTMTWGYINLPTLAMAVAVFVFIKNVSKGKFWQKDAVKKVLRELSSASFGIYLIHVFVMNAVAGKFGIDRSGIPWQMLGAVIIYVICLGIVKILQKLPFGGYIFP